MTEINHGVIDHAMAQLGRMTLLRLPLSTFAFSPALENSFDASTTPVRARELRLTLWLSLFLYEFTNAADYCLLPDLLVWSVALKLALAPFLLIAALYIPAMPSRTRERTLALYAIVSILVLTFVAGQSLSAQAPYALATASLALIHANTTIPLRFKFACLNTAVIVLAVAVTIHAFETVDPKLAFALNLQSVCGGIFSLVANYRLERSARLNYLLACRERLQNDDLAREREVLATLSQTDRLTGLANRVRLEHWSERMFADPDKPSTSIGVLMIDIDYFKRFNDQYGHAAGDACLKAVAGIVAACAPRRHDLVVRYGGEEFLVLLPETTASESIAVAKQVRAAVASRGLVHSSRDDGLGIVTVSVGIAHGGAPTSCLSDLIEAADRALYRAKAHGRNRAEPEGPVLAEAC